MAEAFPIDIRLEIHDEELQKTLRDLSKKAADIRTPLKRSGVHMMSSFDKNFKQEGRPQKWKPLQPNTVAARRKQSSKILQDKGLLRMSVLSKSGKGNIYRLTKDSLAMGSSLKIAPYHQRGTKPYVIRPKRKPLLRFKTTKGWVFARIVHHPGLPARPFVLIQDEDEKAIVDIFADHVMEGAK